MPGLSASPCRDCAAENRWRPFCAANVADSVDLGAWASEQYRVAGAGSTLIPRR